MSRFEKDEYFECFFEGCSFGTKNLDKFEKHIEKCSGVKKTNPRHHRQVVENQSFVPEPRNDFASKLLDSISKMGKLRIDQNTANTSSTHLSF